MKKYNTPEIEMMLLASEDITCINVSNGQGGIEDVIGGEI